MALAATPVHANAGAVVETMLTALEDRSPAWVVAPNTSTAVGAGGRDEREAEEHVVRLPGVDVTLAMDAPPWMWHVIEPALAALDVPSMATPEAIVDLFAALRGDVHCVVSIGSRGCVAYRGAMSSRPLFFHVGGDRSLLVASQIRAIRAVRSIDVSPAGLAPFLVPQLSDLTGTAWTGVQRIPPGQAVILWNGELETRQVCQVEPAEVGSVTREDLVREFRRRLDLAVKRSCEPPDGVLLSGGIDSSSLACVYTSVRNGASRGYALTYDEDLAPCDERRFVDDVEHATGIPVSRLPANRLLPLVAESPEGDEPEMWAYSARNWAMLRHIADSPTHPTATVLAGEGGDELLLGQVFAVADRLARGDATGAEREVQTFPDPEATARAVRGLLAGDYDHRGPRVMRALREIPSWLTGAYVASAGLVDQLAHSYPQLGEPGQLTINYSRGVLGEMGAAGRVQCGGWWEDMGRKAGIKITYPFLDPDLTELVWALPPELFRDKGLEKVVLREALADVLPPSVAVRRDKADALALMHAGLGEAIDVVAAVARGGPLLDLGVIHPAKLLASVDRYQAGDRGLAPALYATVAVDRWLRHMADQTRGALP